MLPLWLRCGGGGNCLTGPAVLARPRCFNHDMSTLLPAQLWTLFFFHFLNSVPALLLVFGTPAKLYRYTPPPLKNKVQSIFTVMQPREEDSEMETSTILTPLTPPQSHFPNHNLRHCGFNWASISLCSPYFLLFPPPGSLHLFGSVDAVNGTAVESHWHQRRP